MPGEIWCQTRGSVLKVSRLLGIEGNVGWHTFRRTFCSLLKASGDDIKVVQELMRHASPSITLGLYAQAFSEDARRAQGKMVEMVRHAPLLAPAEAAGAQCALMCMSVGCNLPVSRRKQWWALQDSNL